MLPNDAINVILLSNHTSDNTTDGYDGYNIEAGIRGEPNGYLYNITEQTDKWDANTEYTLEFIQSIRWEDMDSASQKSCCNKCRPLVSDDYARRRCRRCLLSSERSYWFI